MGKYDSYTKVLLLMDAADGTTTFRDEIGKVWTANGNAQHDTAQRKYGTASALFDGTGDYLSTPNSADFDFGTGDFTIETWIRRNGAQAAFAGIISASHSIGTGWCLTFRDAPNNNYLTFWSDSGYWGEKLIGSTLSDTTWTHIAVERYGNTATLYMGGSSAATWNVTGVSINSSGTGIVVATQHTDNTAYMFNGNLDELRISKGIARYQGAFTPPTRSLRAAGGLFGFHG